MESLIDLGYAQATCECGRVNRIRCYLDIGDGQPPEDPPFRPVAIGEVNYHYAAGEMGFTCPCGATVAIDDEPVTCTCGRLYRVRHYLEVKEKG